MADKKLKSQDKQELAKVDHGRFMAQALIDGMLANPDRIWTTQGHTRFDVYKDLLRDDQVKSCFQQRRSAVTNAEWYVEPGEGDSDESPVVKYVEWLLGQFQFDQICDKMLYAVHYGYQVGELMYGYDEDSGFIYLEDVKVRDRRRFKFGTKGELYLHDGLKKQLMPADKFWVLSVGADNSDNPYGEGLAHSLYWPVFFKRNGVKFWLIYLEKFGMPTASVKLDQSQVRDPEQRAIALQILDSIQSDSGVVIPKDFEVELIEASRGGAVDYDTLERAMDRAIAKIILSQTMTTDDGSSRSQAEVHKDVRDEVVKADADALCHTFNTQVLPKLIELNFPGAKVPKVWRRTEPEADLVKMAERDNKIMALGYEPTEEYVEETYGPGWRKKQESVAPIGNGIPEMGTEFAEVSDLTERRIKHRKDQQAIIDAAEYMGGKYREAYGKRLDQIMAAMDESDTPLEFEEKLKQMMEEPAEEDTADMITRASFYSRLMGMLKGQR